ncbi:MAG: hydantoinase/oxoprolinase family protein [Alphaproteobacteria bacterium]|nr:hydantoinase/oxoprolinase family protein [Alphaproteobacteria bacterium]
MGRLATDVGGTFTDLVYFDEASNALRVAKTLTTPADPSRGVIEAIDRAGLVAEAATYFVHGGTTVINAITEHNGVKTALVTTRGFRDVLEIGRGNRPDLYNLLFHTPASFVPRALRFEVGGRIGVDGRELEPLNLDDLDGLAASCQREKVAAIAIQLLHSYAFPAHESAAARYLRDRLPRVTVTASHEISREWREYERATTAVLNAYVQPIVQRYFDNLEARLRATGIRCALFAMQSNGGTTTFDWARTHPITLIESGPAAGVNGAALIGAQCREPNVISLDIGGTTAKCSLIEDGEPKVTTGYSLERTRVNPGYPVKVPVIDIVEIGAGGGSIAWLDEANRLSVGPVSAGADPGPASYGLGGIHPTVTDAMLLAGVLDPDDFAGGQIRLSREQAERAFAPLAERLGADTRAAARAVRRVVEANMINALKLVSVQRGYDPREFVLAAFGGGGPMHAAALGRELGVREVIVPRYPGTFSAWGMLATAPRRDIIRTRFLAQDAIGIADIKALFGEMQAEAEGYFASGEAHRAITFSHALELRYVGQEHVVAFPIDLADATIEAILDAFHRAHERTYTFRLPDQPVEFVHFRLTAEAEVPRPRFERLASAAHAAEPKGRRPVDFIDDGVRETLIYARDALPAGFRTAGPLVIEEASATTVVLPGQALAVDELGFLHITEA